MVVFFYFFWLTDDGKGRLSRYVGREKGESEEIVSEKENCLEFLEVSSAYWWENPNCGYSVVEQLRDSVVTHMDASVVENEGPALWRESDCDTDAEVFEQSVWRWQGCHLHVT